MAGCRSLLILPVAAALTVAAGGLFTSCEDKKPDTIAGTIDPERVPTMTTTMVNTVISDSGYLRYRIIAPVWHIYDAAADPYWSFPEGMHMERFSPDMAIDATIDCDSAKFFTRRQLWQLDGAVDISSPDGQRFLTEQLFWSQPDREVYSDSFIHIERPDRVMEGWGFKSNETMSRYTLLNPSGIFPMSQFRPNGEPTTAPYDPAAAGADDPADAQFADKAYNGTPTDTTFVSTAPGSNPRTRRRALQPRRAPKLVPPDTTAFVDTGSVWHSLPVAPVPSR